jgi:hypothetical protein
VDQEAHFKSISLPNMSSVKGSPAVRSALLTVLVIVVDYVTFHPVAREKDRKTMRLKLFGLGKRDTLVKLHLHNLKFHIKF